MNFSSRTREAPKSLLMTADTLGGVWTYATELLKALNKIEPSLQILLATFGRSLSKDQRAQLRPIKNLDLKESTFKLEWMEDPWEDIQRSTDWLKDILQSKPVDFLHFNHFAKLEDFASYPHLVVAHSDVYSWYFAVHQRPPELKWRRYHQLVSNTLRSADLVVTPSTSAWLEVQEFYSLGSHIRKKIIPNGRLLFDFFPQSEKEAFVLSIGRFWDEAKNIRALTEISASCSWPLHLVGDLGGPSGVPKVVAENLHCHGYLPQEETAAMLARASIYIHPAKYEPFGLCVLEAASAGCALILNDIPSLRENWSNAAVFVNMDHKQSLQDALDYLILNPRDRQNLAKLARDRAEDFSAESMAMKYLEAYREVLERRTRAVRPETFSCAS